MKKKSVMSVEVSEDSLQQVFNEWVTGRAGFRVAGAPGWLLRRGQPKDRSSFSSPHAVSVKPDVVWDDSDGTYVLELKSAVKYEPLVVAQAFAEAFLLGDDPKAHGLRHKPVPAMITRFNQWNRGALSFLLDKGFDWGREFYLEFDVLKHGARKWLWVDPPLAPLTSVHQPPFDLDTITDLKHWYQIGTCEAWFGTKQELRLREGLLLRPVIPNEPFAICAAVEGHSNERLLWSGRPSERGEFSLLEGPA